MESTGYSTSDKIAIHVEEALECSACSRVIVVCQCCRGEGWMTSSCPSCHGKRFRKLVTNNNLAPEPMKLLEHKCKFSLLGCEMVMKLDEINLHEKKCPHRIIICPYVGCKREVSLKKFKEHTKEYDCVDDWDGDIGNLLLWPYDLEYRNVNMYLNGVHDGVEEFEGVVMNLHEDVKWRLPRFYAGGQAFYIFLHYFTTSKQSFIHGVIIPDDAERAAKYSAKMILGLDSLHPRRLTYEGLVLSIDDLPDMNSCRARYKYWIVPFEDMKPFIFGGQISFAVSVSKVD